MTTLKLNGKVALNVRHKVTGKGNHSFTYLRGDTGKKLPPLTQEGFGRMVESGTLSVGGSDYRASFELSEIRQNTDEGAVGTGKYRATATLYNVDMGEAGKATLSLTFKDDGTGRYVPSLSGSFPTGGQRGRVAAEPVDGDDLF